MRILTLNENSFEPVDYAERKTVKAVIVNEKGETLLFGKYLVGGGVEAGETWEQALHREALEEAGAIVEIIKPLGEIVAYRDEPKKKYLVEGFLCRYLETVSLPTTEDKEEMDVELLWVRPEFALEKMNADIQAIKSADKNSYTKDQYQSRLYNRESNLKFLSEAFKNRTKDN